MLDSSRTTTEASSILTDYAVIRATTEKLCEPLSPEDATVQSMPEASPAKWHLAHTTWFFETFALSAAGREYRPYRDEYRVLFNSYYNAIGEQHSRPERGLITRPGLEEVMQYRHHVDRSMAALLHDGDAPPRLLEIAELGLHHEQQHQELLLTDVKHLFSCNPLLPAYHGPRSRPPGEERAPEARWIPFEGGTRPIGHDGAGFSFDNERPRHLVLIKPFELASRPVTNAEFLDFMEDGGYDRPELWLADGWTARGQRRWTAPLYCVRRGGDWHQFTLGGLEPLRSEDPAVHVSFYEADAYARWAGARLPTEAEWEIASASVPIDGNLAESGNLHPVRAAAGEGLAQMFGDVWEWTMSPYTPYPGYAPPEGALGEYNGKFMCNQMVLRGGSCATPRSHVRRTYRNFFYPPDRWQFSGFRLARTTR
jgi:ergothioneine biosynthesis protein EgtB